MVSDDQRATPRSNTKYGDRLADDAWDEPEPEPDGGEPRARVTDHELDVAYDTEPDAEDNYDRERYTVTIRYDDESGEPYVLYAVEHRWKGNYWRDVTDWDWRDVPEPVRERVVAALPIDDPAVLTSEHRLIEAGGESRWQKHHKHRVESMSGDEMWGLSYLKEALRQLDLATEAFDDGTTGQAIAEKVASALRTGISGLEPTNGTEADR